MKLTVETEVPQKDVVVYGGDHSPWVQAVLLGLHLKHVSYRVHSFPPRKVFRFSGVLMPALRLNDDSWLLQSQDILEAYGYGRLERDDFRALLKALVGGAHRVDSTIRFWRLWSWVADEHRNPFVRLRNVMFRPFLVLYFNVALTRLKQVPQALPSLIQIRENYLPWQQALEETGTPFLDGDKPGLRDIYLFAAVQLHASMPVPPMDVLCTDPELDRLRAWVYEMQKACVGYRHMYSVKYFPVDGGVQPDRSSLCERAGFWLGSALILLLAPITVPWVRKKMGMVRRNGLIVRSVRIE
ncbi:MAG: hypothetical protein GKR90_27165 [Pseudomonadales bacterium]|nr:hypothetical protein [Pseudomonadales bacterium]